MAKKQAAAPGRSRDAAGQVAEYVGASLADLMNRKDALARQPAEVEQAIARAGRQAGAKVARAVPGAKRARALPGAKGGKAKAAAPAGRTGNRKKNRPPPPDDPMVAVTMRATAADAKARAAQQVRSSRRAGNR